MSVRPAYSTRVQARRSTAAMVCIVALAAVVAGCTANAGEHPKASDEVSSPAPSSSAPPVSEATITSNIDDRASDVPVDETVTLTAENGTFDEVTVAIGRKGNKELAGELSSDKTTWTSTQALEPGLRYTAEAVAVDSEGLEAESTTKFRAEDLTLDQQTFPSIAPLNGETVGVGMPVIVQFDVAVTNHKAFEKHLSVQSTPKQAGSWHWVNDNEVHWRPKTYWQPGTDVTVKADINSVHAGNGVYGQMDRSASFHVGDSIVSKVDIASHTMKVFINGDLARTMPVSAGKPGFVTRSGTKVIIEKVRHKTMDAATIGISKDDPEYYNLDVEYAMRVTYSGEFLHAAPWSEGSQGIANVSHGCVGMSLADAAWLFNLTKRGDVVEVRGSDRHMTLYNGYGDWNASFSDYKQGSAL
jgi:lipoprotein-anchoring transpeptidase ErfK/SrfK